MTSVKLKADKLDLTKPEGARRFFREYRGPEGHPILEVMHTEKGTINPLLSDDREVCELAIYFNNHLYARGLGQMVHEEIH